MAKDHRSLAGLIRREDVKDDRVIAAFDRVDRGDFVPPGERREAYRDRPVRIGHGQTTSQPSLIARMLAVAEIKEDDRVLEVGTGYGFQTALMACLASEVVSVERHAPLAEVARANLRRAGLSAHVHVSDGWSGFEDMSPYDAIIVSAAAPEIPPALVEQLAEGGRLVIPLVGAFGEDVILFRKIRGELVRDRVVTPARFVPLVHEEPS